MKKSIGILCVFLLLTGITLNLYALENERKPELKKEFVKLKYVEAEEVHKVLRSFQSPYGRITSNHDLNIITIQDTPEIVDKMLSIIKEIDVKPVDILITVDLILGSMDLVEIPDLAKLTEGKQSKKTLESDPIIKELKNVLGYTHYYKIDSSFLRIQDDKYSDLKLGGHDLDVRLRLEPRYVKEQKGDTFQLELALVQQVSAIKTDKIERKEREIVLIRTTLTVKSGERTVVGVSKLDGGNRALILILSGKVIK
ncbi:MAG: hypothetical protein GTN73_08170 [Candidatus Aminicenantes bacterium]|nr:hypothetical protein [Candidatus Aminicenantes bacterium]